MGLGSTVWPTSPTRAHGALEEGPCHRQSLISRLRFVSLLSTTWRVCTRGMPTAWPAPFTLRCPSATCVRWARASSTWTSGARRRSSRRPPQADPSGYVFLRSWPAPKFVWMAAPEWGAAPTDASKIEISILDRASGIASLKVLWGFDANGENPTGLDYIDAAKCDGRWQGINIVWRVNPMSDYADQVWDR